MQPNKKWFEDCGWYKERSSSDGGWLHPWQCQVHDDDDDGEDLDDDDGDDDDDDQGQLLRAGEFGREGVPELDISAVVFLIDQPKVG